MVKVGEDERLPMRRRAAMPRFRKKHLAAPTLNHIRRGFRLKEGRLHRLGAMRPHRPGMFDPRDEDGIVTLLHDSPQPGLREDVRDERLPCGAGGSG